MDLSAIWPRLDSLKLTVLDSKEDSKTRRVIDLADLKFNFHSQTDRLDRLPQ